MRFERLSIIVRMDLVTVARARLRMTDSNVIPGLAQCSPVRSTDGSLPFLLIHDEILPPTGGTTR